jgi:hypothetical protein
MSALSTREIHAAPQVKGLRSATETLGPSGVARWRVRSSGRLLLREGSGDGGRVVALLSVLEDPVVRLAAFVLTTGCQNNIDKAVTMPRLTISRLPRQPSR